MGFGEEEEGKKSKKMMACGRGWRLLLPMSPKRSFPVSWSKTTQGSLPMVLSVSALAAGIRRRRAEVRKRKERGRQVREEEED